MRSPSRHLIALLAFLATAACGAPEISEVETRKQPAPVENDQPVANLDELLAGAPSNDEIPPEPGAFFTLPPKYDVKKYDSPVKSQGSRGVCSIFASVALMEHLYIKEGTITNPDFSEQYLQWSAKFEVGSFPDSSGSNNYYNLRAISQYGIVTEDVEPYETFQWDERNDPDCKSVVEGSDDGLPTKCYTNGDPSPEALAAPKYRLPTARYLNTSSIKSYIADNDAAVAIGLTFFYQSWNHRRSELKTNPEYWRMGFVLYPNDADKEKSLAKRAGHAILLVGWDDELEVPMVDGEGNVLLDENGVPMREKGFYVFKNSWGTGNFGVNNPIGDGYGYISYRYVSEYGSAMVAGLPTDIPVIDEPVETIELGNDTAIDIPDDDEAGISSTIESTDPGIVKSIDVTVDVTHTYKGDLVVELVKDDGRSVVLHDRAGGSAHDLKTTYTTTEFIGLPVAGTWTLKISDHAAIDIGTLNAWSLKVALQPE